MRQRAGLVDLEELRQLVFVPRMEAIPAHPERLRCSCRVVAAPVQRDREIHQLDQPLAQVVRCGGCLGLLRQNCLHMPPLHQSHRLLAMLFPEFLDDPAIDLLRAGREIEELGRAIPERDKLADAVGLGPVRPDKPARLVAVDGILIALNEILGPVIAPQLC